MNFKEAMYKLIKDNNSSFARLAERLGYEKPSSIGNVIKRGDARVSMMVKICNELDYDIIIRPRGGNDRAERTIVLNEVPDRKDNRGKWR